MSSIQRARGRLTRRLVLSEGAAFAAGVMLIACGGDKGGGVPTVTVVANDFSFKMDRAKVPAGSVHFVLRNESKTYQHELWVYPKEQAKLPDLIAQKDAGKASETDFLQGIAGRVKAIDPGITGSVDITLQPGMYELACFVTTTIAGKSMVHHELGMRSLLTVN